MSPRKLLSLVCISLALLSLPVRTIHAHDVVELLVSDQTIHNGYIVINHIYEYEAGWVIIQNNDNEAGNPVIGMVYIPPENTFHLLIPIDMSTATSELTATLHIDKGKVGEYEFPGTDVVDTYENGDTISAKFNVVGISVKDQFISDTKTVLLDKIIAQKDGFISIHADDPGNSLVGRSPIKAGINADVAVTVDPAKVTPKMIAAIDTDNGTLDNLAAGEPFWTNDHIRVSDQLVDTENQVVIPSVLASKDGWITVYSMAEGNPVIGKTAVKAGLTSNVLVKTGDAARTTNTVKAALNTLDDVPVKDSTGNIVASSFLISNGISVQDQKASDVVKSGSIMIDRVVCAQNGWLAIHSTEAGNPVIGVAFVHSGVNLQVPVMVSTDYLTKSVVAVLHIDAGQLGQYEFPDPDVPVKDSKGNVVSQQINLEAQGQASQTLPSDSFAGVISAILVVGLFVLLIFNLWKRRSQNRTIQL